MSVGVQFKFTTMLSSIMLRNKEKNVRQHQLTDQIDAYSGLAGDGAVHWAGINLRASGGAA